MNKKFYYYLSKEGNKLPLVIEDGRITIFDRKNKKPLQKFTENLLHSFGKNAKHAIQKRIIEASVNSMDELYVWLDKYDDLYLKLNKAKDEERKILNEINSFLYPRMTYAKTKEIGCTDIVYWDNEPIINPKTNNEFFTHEDAVSLLEKKKREYYDEFHNELKEKKNCEEKGHTLSFPGEIDMESSYIWEDAAMLDDLIEEEKVHPEGL